jgi:radical SAM superfamily enzyme YgiQ (UPF0313 family)
MHYSKNVNRPPQEADNILLQVTTGCSHGKCSFCDFFPNEEFGLQPIEYIEEDLIEWSKLNPTRKRVWLLNGDAFTLRSENLIVIHDLIKKHLKNVESIGMYASVLNIKNKSVEELTHLRSLGFNMLYIGVETGDENALVNANTGYNRKEILTQLRKLEDANIEYHVSLIAGLGGAGTAKRVGRATAELMNQLNPTEIFMGPLFVLPRAPLSTLVEKGDFLPPTEKEYLEEHYSFVTNYIGKSNLLLMPTPNSQMIPVVGIKKREEYLESLDKMIKKFNKGTEIKLKLARKLVQKIRFLR